MRKFLVLTFNMRAVCLIKRVCSWLIVLILLSMIYTFFSFDLPSFFLLEKLQFSSIYFSFDL